MKSIRYHHHFMLGYLKLLLTKVLGRPAFTFVFILAFTAMAASSLLIYVVEHGSNPAFATFLDAAYFTVSTMTSVGFGDITPRTPLGKMISMGMMLLGTFIFVSFTAVVASAVMEVEQEAKNHSHLK